LDDRLAEIDRDRDWLEATIDRYEGMWQYRQQLPSADERFEPLTPDHSALAAWITAGIRGFGRCLEVIQAVQRAIRDRTADGPPGILAATTRATIVAWGLGRIVGDYDRTLPVVFCEPPSDISVRLAYDGLVSHVLALPEVDEWPEMLGSSILWRACGLADGLRPQTPNPNVEASLNALIAEIRPVVEPTVVSQWASDWRDYKDMRNGFTHVVAGDRGRYCFADLADKMRSRSEVAVALTSITNFVGHTVALQLQDDEPARWKVAADGLDWELEAFADLT
jgi:hypothetical protein